ncbi:IS3 family transposase [Bradyrhizobium sp. sGM-13]|uniref:IS3 family transposase n=1 Tax=Bradyrhizobium sp. sGM-13 TaxID=2831781 RepID=UPI002111205A|nr:IS3 family transposase [Bradyrhizobium sp. sGM-13]
MLDRADKALSIRRQCVLLGIARSGVYRPPRPANDNDLALMRRIDELFTAWPFLGSRRMTAMLKAEGLQVNRKCVQRLMRKMGIAALGPKPNTTKLPPRHKIYPFLLRNMTIDRPNQVWAADIMCLQIGRGFLYLVAIIDWGEPCGSGVAYLQYHGYLVLSRCARRRFGTVWQARNLQHPAEKKARGAIVPVLLGEEEGLTAGSMQRLTLTPPRRGGRVPAPGEQQAFGNTRRRLAGTASAPSGCIDAFPQPLHAIRVIDFSMGWAGPLCTRTLADLGADVIKIEAIQYPDWWRGLTEGLLTSTAKCTKRRHASASWFATSAVSRLT